MELRDPYGVRTSELQNLGVLPNSDLREKLAEGSQDVFAKTFKITF